MANKNILKEVVRLRKRAKNIRNYAVLHKDLNRLMDARQNLEMAVYGLNKELQNPSGHEDVDRKEVVERLYQCLGSIGGTWRDAALLSDNQADQDEYWSTAIQFYDEAHKIEQGEDPRSQGHEFVDSYNLVQRLIVRVLQNPLCQSDPDEDLGSGLNVPQHVQEAEALVREQLRGPRKDDAWAMADLAELNILFHGASREEAWRDFDQEVRSAEAYETNYRAFNALVLAGQRCDPPPDWLPVAKRTVSWLADKLKIHYGIELPPGLF